MNIFIILKSFFCLFAVFAVFSVDAAHTDKQHTLIRQSQNESKKAILQADVDAQLQEQADLKFITVHHLSRLLDIVFKLGLPFMNDVIKAEISSGLNACVKPDGQAKKWMVGKNAKCPIQTENVEYSLDPLDLTAAAKPKIVPIHEHEQCLDIRTLFGDETGDERSKTCNGISVVAEGGCESLSGMSNFKINEIGVEGKGSLSQPVFMVNVEAQFPTLNLNGCAFSAKEQKSGLGFAVKADSAIRVSKFSVSVEVEISQIKFLHIIKEFVPLFCKGKGVTRMFLNSLKLKLLDIEFTIPQITPPKWSHDASKGVEELMDTAAAITMITDQIPKVIDTVVKPANKLMQDIVEREVREFMSDDFRALRENKYALAKIDEILGDTAAAKFGGTTIDVVCGFNKVVQFVGKAIDKVGAALSRGWKTFTGWFSLEELRAMALNHTEYVRLRQNNSHVFIRARKPLVPRTLRKL